MFSHVTFQAEAGLEEEVEVGTHGCTRTVIPRMFFSF